MTRVGSKLVGEFLDTIWECEVLGERDRGLGLGWFWGEGRGGCDLPLFCVWMLRLWCVGQGVWRVGRMAGRTVGWVGELLFCGFAEELLEDTVVKVVSMELGDRLNRFRRECARSRNPGSSALYRYYFCRTRPREKTVRLRKTTFTC